MEQFLKDNYHILIFYEYVRTSSSDGYTNKYAYAKNYETALSYINYDKIKYDSPFGTIISKEDICKESPEWGYYNIYLYEITNLNHKIFRNSLLYIFQCYQESISHSNYTINFIDLNDHEDILDFNKHVIKYHFNVCTNDILITLFNKIRYDIDLNLITDIKNKINNNKGFSGYGYFNDSEFSHFTSFVVRFENDEN